LEERDEPPETDVSGPDRPGDDTRGAVVARPPLHARARIEGVEAGVAAGLVSAAESKDVAWTGPEGALGEDPAAREDGDIWIDYDDPYDRSTKSRRHYLFLNLHYYPCFCPCLLLL